MTDVSFVPVLADAHLGQNFKRTGAMDGRGRLAQLLKSKTTRRARAAQARVHEWPHWLARWRRNGQHIVNRIVALEPPRGAGVSAVALLLLASSYYGAVKGGHADAIAAQVQDICDSVANSLGFRVSAVELAGQHHVSRETVLTLAGITGRSSLLFLNAAHTRARLLTDPWIAQASVLKLYPGRLRIGIKERKPFALWQKNGAVSLIASDGTVLEPYVPASFASLPLLVGRGAQHAGQDFLNLVNRHADIAHRVQASVLVAERRWDLHLDNGIVVMLPENDPERALATLSELDRSKKLLSRDIVTVDLRLPDRVSVQLSDAAAAAREEALKAAADKKKKKGGEA
jgi:cell division protein FtsQ